MEHHDMRILNFLLFTIISTLSINLYAKEITTQVTEVTPEKQTEITNFLKTRELTEAETAKIQKYSTYTVTNMRERGMADFDYDRKSVDFLSDVLDKKGRGYSEQAKNVLPTLWGSYLGDALIKTYGGSWVIMGDGSYGVKLKNEQLLFPITRVGKHINSGPEYAILAMFDAVTTVETMQVDLPKQ